MLNIRLYRPFPAENFLTKLPKTVERVAVLDRTKEPGSGGEPLLLDVQSVLYDSETRPLVIGGRYGLGSKDVTPDQILGVYSHLMTEKPKPRFTIGITDDITNLSIENDGPSDLTSEKLSNANSGVLARMVLLAQIKPQSKLLAIIPIYTHRVTFPMIRKIGRANCFAFALW